jgi:hypothetical protein
MCMPHTTSWHSFNIHLRPISTCTCTPDVRRSTPCKPSLGCSNTQSVRAAGQQHSAMQPQPWERHCCPAVSHASTANTAQPPLHSACIQGRRHSEPGGQGAQCSGHPGIQPLESSQAGTCASAATQQGGMDCVGGMRVVASSSSDGPAAAAAASAAAGGSFHACSRPQAPPSSAKKADWSSALSKGTVLQIPVAGGCHCGSCTFWSQRWLVSRARRSAASTGERCCCTHATHNVFVQRVTHSSVCTSTSARKSVTASRIQLTQFGTLSCQSCCCCCLLLHILLLCPACLVVSDGWNWQQSQAIVTFDVDHMEKTHSFGNNVFTTTT